MLKLSGELCEIGYLSDEDGETGIVIERPDSSFVTIKGLTDDEARQLVQYLWSGIEIIIKEK
jgi:hypothetical protein